MPKLDDLLGRARGPLGPAGTVDLGQRQGLLAELSDLLSRTNGFFLFNAGVHIFRAGPQGHGYDVESWNQSATWKDTYQGLADDLFCFGQDVLGTQFAIVGNKSVVAFEPEACGREVVGASLEDWAAWLLGNPDVHATAGLAHAWQKQNRPLDLTERLIPRQLLVLGGELTLENLVAKDAAECMRIRGPIAHQIQDLPDGATISLNVSE